MALNVALVETADKSIGFDYRAFIAKYGGGAVANYNDKQTVYVQGDKADALFYIVSGTVKITILSEFGREAVIALLGAGDFFGEGRLENHAMRRSTVMATSNGTIARFEQAVVSRALAEDPAFTNLFLRYILERNIKLREGLTDQFFYTSEARLARILVALANIVPGAQSNIIAIPVSQEMLANMVGTTRSRINQFMNKFRRLGHIDYNGKIEVRISLMDLILQGQPQNGNGEPQGGHA